MTTKDLETAYREAEAKAQAIMAEKDEALAKVKAKYATKLQKANIDAAEKQKAFLDAEAAEALLDRPDGQVVADALGLTLPE